MQLNQEIRFCVAPMMDWRKKHGISIAYSNTCAWIEHGRSTFLSFPFMRKTSIMAAGLRHDTQVSPAVQNLRASATEYPKFVAHRATKFGVEVLNPLPVSLPIATGHSCPTRLGIRVNAGFGRGDLRDHLRSSRRVFGAASGFSCQVQRARERGRSAGRVPGAMFLAPWPRRRRDWPSEKVTSRTQ